MSGRLGLLCAGQGSAPSGADASAQLETQPALVEASLDQWAALAPEVPEPVVVAGYSLGELVAATIAGALTPQLAQRLVAVRARLMVDATTVPSGLVALHGRQIFARREEIEAAGGAIAIVNGPDEVVIGGSLVALEAVERSLGRAVRATPLPVGVPSHTAALAAAADAFRTALAASEITDARIPIVRSRDGAVVRARDEVIDLLAQNICQTVRWDRTMEVLAEQQADGFVELGAGASLARLWAEHQGAPWAHALSEFSDPRAAASWVTGHLAP